MFYLLRSSAIVCDHDRRIADDRRSMFPYDRRRSQTLLRSAIRDDMETSLKLFTLDGARPQKFVQETFVHNFDFITQAYLLHY